MELKATTLGKRMAQHPYDRVQLLNAGVKVSGDRHEYLIPFNQLLSVHCKRGLVWGELEFVLPADQVVRLHGTEWGETQRFHHHLNQLWQQWSQDMSVIAAGVLQKVLDDIAQSNAQHSWLSRLQSAGLHQKIRQALSALPLSVARLEEFDNCRDAWRQCQAWLNDKDKSRLAHNQAWPDAMLTQYADFFSTVESSPLNPAQARAVVNGEQSLLVLAGAGGGKKAGGTVQNQPARLSFFEREKPIEKETKLSKKEQAVLAEFKAMDLLDMTPIQVMNELYRLQKKLK